MANASEVETCPVCNSPLLIETKVVAGVKEIQYYVCPKGHDIPDQMEPPSAAE